MIILRADCKIFGFCTFINWRQTKSVLHDQPLQLHALVMLHITLVLTTFENSLHPDHSVSLDLDPNRLTL